MRIGYACINITLADEGIRVNRSLMKRTFLSKGISRASALALQNVLDLEKIIEWNTANNLFLYRMSSDMFPWMSEYELEDLPDFEEISRVLKRIGEKVTKSQVRLTYHPGPFNVLATLNQDMLKKTIKELRQHGEIMDLLGLPRTPFAKINIHIGGAYGNKDAALMRFSENFRALPEATQRRLTVENDDKPNMYPVKDLVKVHDTIGIPIVFDYHHHHFCTGGLAEEEAVLLAHATWPEDITPIVHYSSSRKLEDPTTIATAHADFIHEKINLYGKSADIMLEAKAKELAVKKYLAEHEQAGKN